MANRATLDAGRQLANLVGAVAQIAIGVGFGATQATVANENATLIVPAGYAFAIWSVIFLLSLIYAVHQALPANREHGLYRRIGWFTAAAFLGDALWEVIFPARWFVPAQLVLIAVFACLVVAVFRFAGEARADRLEPVDRWLTAPMLGLFAGWVTAAAFVGLGATLVSQGLPGQNGAAAIWGVILLGGAGFVAAALLTVLKTGPAAGWIAFGLAVLWALAAVIVKQRDASTATTVAAALIGLALMALALVYWPARRSEARVIGFRS